MAQDIPRRLPPDSTGRQEGSDSLGSADGSVRDFLRIVGDVLPPAGTEREAPSPRRKIGRFEVIEELGRGTFGLVLRVFDTQLERERAMKLPHDRTLASPRARTRFINEMRYAASIEHPNVVRMDEPGEVGDLVFQVMEYCPDGSLASWLERRPAERPVPPGWAALLVAQIADGVQAAHARRTVHRDLKPGNILLARVGEFDGADPPNFCPKVGDFGMARVLDDPDGGLTEDDATIGTLAYMSPEQARGDRDVIGPASDIHALGAILYELLTRQKVYPAADRIELRARIIAADPPPSPRTIRRDVPRELEVICRSCLAKDPGARYTTAAALSEDLRRFHRGDPVKGTPLAKRIMAGLRRHGRLAATAAVLALLIALVGGLIYYQQSLAASVWIEKFEHAGLGALPRLLAEPAASDRAHEPRLVAMYDGDDQTKKLLAAVALAGRHPFCSEFAYEALLDASPADVGPLARGLTLRLPKLADRLAHEVSAPRREAEFRDPEALDRRHANAAAALVVLGRPGSGLGLLQSSSDPQARSFLIHTLGPAGARPLDLLHHVANTDEPSVRIGLIQSLGEVPAGAWTASSREQAVEELLDLYRNNPDAGIHGSAKWVLRHWSRDADLARADAELKGLERPEFRWRIGRSGLTFVQFEDPKTDRTIEISDSEVTREQFLTFLPGYQASALKTFSPDPDCPMTSMIHVPAAGFCNWLASRDVPAGDPPRPTAYLWTKDGIWEPDPKAVDEGGFRLPTTHEFEVACRAKTATKRYYGDTDALLKHYAWTDSTCRGRSMPVARLKPNDFGLFDMLGNAQEITQHPKDATNPFLQAMFCGGGLMHLDYAVDFKCRSLIQDVRQRYSIESVGFRVARTLPRAATPARPR
jgi:serine/threonine protein kinase